MGDGVAGACWVGLSTCLFSLVCTLVCIFIDSIYRPNDSQSISIASINKDFKRSDSLEDATDIKSASKNFPSIIMKNTFIRHFIFYSFDIFKLRRCSLFQHGRLGVPPRTLLLRGYFTGQLAMSIPDTAAFHGSDYRNCS